MKFEQLYREVVNKGIEVDIRGRKAIEKTLVDKKKAFDKLEKKEQEIFDLETLVNPFADTRMLNGSGDAEIKSMIVGVDVEGDELLLADRLNEKGTKIDLVVGHHPEGRAYANFYDVMDLQVDAFINKGLSASFAENLLTERKGQVGRRVHAANHQRYVDVARLLNLNYMCMHTPCDNLAHQFVNRLVEKEKPDTLGKLLDLLLVIPEYKDAAKNNNAPQITIGSKSARVSKIMVEFTGGTEGPEGVYNRLSASGIDTIVAMHQSDEHNKKCKEANINVIVASHIASDAVGINLMLDHLESKGKIKIYEFSGFRRFARKKSN